MTPHVHLSLQLLHLMPVLAALLAGLAAALFVGSPTGRISRIGSETNGGRTATRPAALRSWVRGRPDAPPMTRRLVLGLAAALAVGVLAYTVGGVFALLGWCVAPLVVPVCVVVLGHLEPVRARRRRERLRSGVPHALELMSACLAAGMPLRTATAAVAECFEGPVADDLHQVLALVNLGTADADAWNSLRSSPEWGATVVDLTRSVESGTRMVDVLLHHAHDARDRRRATVEVEAKAVGVRSVLPLMVCFMPAFLLVGVFPTVASALLNALP